MWSQDCHLGVTSDWFGARCFLTLIQCIYGMLKNFGSLSKWSKLCNMSTIPSIYSLSWQECHRICTTLLASADIPILFDRHMLVGVLGIVKSYLPRQWLNTFNICRNKARVGKAFSLRDPLFHQKWPFCGFFMARLSAAWQHREGTPYKCKRHKVLPSYTPPIDRPKNMSFMISLSLVSARPPLYIKLSMWQWH